MNVTQYDAMNQKQRDQFAGKRHANQLIERLHRLLSVHKKYGISSPPIVDLAQEMIMLIETMGRHPAPYGIAVIATLKDSRASDHGLFYKAVSHALDHHTHMRTK